MVYQTVNTSVKRVFVFSTVMLKLSYIVNYKAPRSSETKDQFAFLRAGRTWIESQIH